MALIFIRKGLFIILKVEDLKVIPTKDVMIKLSQKIMAISLHPTDYILLRNRQDGMKKE